MHCYQCTENVLQPIRLAPGLPGRGCSTCGGVYVDLLTYRHWRDDHAVLDPKEPVAEPAVETDNGKALICQRCQKIMLKYRIAADRDNYVDVCTTCDGVWLDGGEWSLLRALDLQDKLTRIMSAPWQRALRQTSAASQFQHRLADALGPDRLQALEAFVAWASDSEHKDLVLRYFREHDLM